VFLSGSGSLFSGSVKLALANGFGEAGQFVVEGDDGVAVAEFAGATPAGKVLFS